MPHRHGLTNLALGAIGLTLWWPMLRRPAGFYVLAGHDGTSTVCSAWYTVYLLCVVAFVLFAARRAYRCDVAGEVRRSSHGGIRTRQKRVAPVGVGPDDLAGRGGASPLEPCMGAGAKEGSATSSLCQGGLSPLKPCVVVACAQAVLKLAELGLHPAGVAGVVLAGADVVLYAAVFVCLTCVWAVWARALGPRACVVVSALTFALSFCVRMVAFLPAGVDAAVMAVLPAVSMALGALARRGVRAGRPGRPIWTGYSASAWETVRASLRGSVGLLAVFLVIAAVARGVAFGMPDGSLLPAALTRQDGMTMVLALGILAYCLVHGSPSRLPGVVWPVATIILFAGLFLMAGAEGDLVVAGRETMVVGRTVLGLLFWLMLAGNESGEPLLSFAVPFILTDAVSALLGYVVVPLALEVCGYGMTASSTMVASAVTFALVVVSVFFFGRQMGETAGGAREAAMGAGTVPSGRVAGVSAATDITDPSQLQKRASAFASSGLTEREERVASLLAEGNSQKRIAELMGVSIGTVQTHVKAVYRKLGVHSKQELIDLAHR